MKLLDKLVVAEELDLTRKAVLGHDLPQSTIESRSGVIGILDGDHDGTAFPDVRDWVSFQIRVHVLELCEEFIVSGIVCQLGTYFG